MRNSAAPQWWLPALRVPSAPAHHVRDLVAHRNRKEDEEVYEKDGPGGRRAGRAASHRLEMHGTPHQKTGMLKKLKKVIPNARITENVAPCLQ